MALADDVVVEIVRRRNLERAAAEFGIHIVVGDHRNPPVRERQFHVLAYQVAIAFVVGVHGYCRVAEHGLWSRGRDYHVPFAIRDGITNVPQEAVLFFGDHFQIGDCRVQYRVPVHQAFAAVDQSFVVKTHEGFAHRPGQTLIHGEALGGPIHRGTHAPQLPGDGAAGMIFPLPHAAQEFLAADVVPGEPLAIELTLDDDLCRDAGVIRSSLPEGVIAVHAVVSGQGIHDGDLECVTHVQTAGDIRRRDHDAVGIALATRFEIAVFLPGLVPGLLYLLWIVGLVHKSLEIPPWP